MGSESEPDRRIKFRYSITKRVISKTELYNSKQLQKDSGLVTEVVNDLRILW